jgi:hypothetical protein
VAGFVTAGPAKRNSAAATVFCGSGRQPGGLPPDAFERMATTTANTTRAGLLGGRSPLLRLQSDERLIALMRAGNDAAFEVLFGRYRSRLLGFCRHMLGSKEDAEDVLQEVFANA